MAHREIVDAGGMRWEVWEVHPTLAERRAESDRRTVVRNSPERRRELQKRTSLGPDLRQGWLAFQSRTERRRCTPIPGRWAEMDDVQLLDVLSHAKRANAPRRLIE